MFSFLIKYNFICIYLFTWQLKMCMAQDRGYYSTDCEPGLYWKEDKFTERYNTVEQETNWEFCDRSLFVSSSEYCCETCPRGTYRETTEKWPSIETCKLCAKGKYYVQYQHCESECHTKSYTECTNCAEGFYSSKLGSSSCKHCHGFNMVANVERCNCVDGGYGFEGSGIFDEDTFECVSCEEGKTATRINEEPYWSYGFSSVAPDGGGWNFESDVPDYKCLHNTIPSCNNNEYYDIVFDQCKSCPTGKFKFYKPEVVDTIVPGSYECQFISTCEPGKFFDTDIAICRDCVAGKYSRNSGNFDNIVSECIDCPVQSYSSTGASTCTRCERGKSQQLPGQSSCEDKCPAGYYSGSVACRQCVQDNTFTPERNLFSDCLQCPNGKRSFYDQELMPLLTECLDCEECPAGQYRTGCSGRNPGTCEDCLKCPEGEINVGCRWTRSQNEQSGLCFPEELVVRTPTCPETGKSDESSSGLGGFSFKSLFGLDETEVNFQCSNPCVGTPTEDSGFCDGPHPCNIRACSMTASADIFDFEDKDGVAGQTFRQARACPVEFDENELQGTDFLEFQNFTRINQKRKIKCQTCLECGSSGSDENAQNVNNYGRGCAHECTILLCEVGEIWDWTQKQCVHCNELEDMRLCLSQEVNLKARDISGNRPRLLVGGESCKEKPAVTQFASDFRASYGTCAECATKTCPDSLFHASCREDHCQACLPHTTPDIHIPLHTQEFLDGSFQRKSVFCQFWGCEAGKTGVKNNGQLCSGTCADNACSEFDIQLNCVLPHLSNRCVPNIASSQHKRGMLIESFVLGLQTNILEPLGIDSHLMHSSFENAIIVLSDESSEDNLFQCVWNSIDIKDNFYDAAGISNTFFPRTSALADQLSERGSKHCHERTPNSSIIYASLPLQNVVSFDNYDQHRILLDNPARVMAWDRYSGRSDCVDCPENIDSSALQKPPDATNRRLTGAYLGDLFLAMHMKNSKTSSVLIPLPQTRMSTMSWVSRWQFSFWASVLTAKNDDVSVNVEHSYETPLLKKINRLQFTLNGRLGLSESYQSDINLQNYMNASETAPYPLLLTDKVYCFDSVMQFNFMEARWGRKTFTSQKHHAALEHEIETFPRDLNEISRHNCHSDTVFGGGGIESSGDIIAFKRYSNEFPENTENTKERLLVVNKNYVSLLTLLGISVVDSVKYITFGPQMRNMITDAHIMNIYAFDRYTATAYYKRVFLYAMRLPQIVSNFLASPFLQVKFIHVPDSIPKQIELTLGTIVLPKCGLCVEEYGKSVIVAFSSLSTEFSSGFLQLLTPEVALLEDWSEINRNWRVLLQLKNFETDENQNSEILVRDVTEMSIVYNREWSLVNSLHQIEAGDFIFDANNDNVTDDTFKSSFRESNEVQLVSVLCSTDLTAFCTLHATFVSYTATPDKKEMTAKEQIFIELTENRYESITTLCIPDQSLVINVRSNGNEKIYHVRNVKHPIFQEIFDSIFHDKSVFTVLHNMYITLDDTGQVSVVGKLEGFSANSNIGYCVATEVQLEFTTSAVPYYQTYQNPNSFFVIKSPDVLDLVYSSEDDEGQIRNPSHVRLDQQHLQDFEICVENNSTTKFKYMNFLLGLNSGLRFTCSDCLLVDKVPADYLSVKRVSRETFRSLKYEIENKEHSFILTENPYIQIRFEQNSSLIEYVAYEEQNIQYSIQNAHERRPLQAFTVNVSVTDKICLVGDVSITDLYESDDQIFSVSGIISSDLFPYSTEEVKLSAEWKPYVWVGSHKYNSGSQFMKLNFDRKSDTFWQDLTQDVTVGIDGLQLLPLFNFPHVSNSHDNSVFAFVQIPTKQDLVLSGIAEIMSGNNIENWEKIFTSIQIFGTTCTYRIKIIPLHENSLSKIPPPGSAIDEMGCTLLSPGFCQLEIPTQILNSRREVMIMATHLELQSPNAECYIKDASDENFKSSGHQFSVTVLPLQRIYQCDRNHFWSETTQTCKSCTDHEVVCPMGEYIEGCDLLGLSITCQPCPQPRDTEYALFTWGENCEINCQEGYYKTEDKNNVCLQCTTDLEVTCSKTPGLKWQACSTYSNEKCVPCDPIATGLYGAYETFTNTSECATTCIDGTFRDIFRVPENSEWENKPYYICDEYIEVPNAPGTPRESSTDEAYLLSCKSACDNPQTLNPSSGSIKCNGFYRTATEPHTCRICLSEMYLKSPSGWNYTAYPDEVFHWDGFGRTIPISGSDSCIPCSSHQDVISKAKLTIDPTAYYRTLPCTESSNTLAESCNSEKLTQNGTYVSDAPSADTDNSGLANDCLIDCPEGWHRVPKTYTRDLNSERVPVAQWSGYDCVLCDTFDSSGVKLPQYSFTVNFDCELTCNHSSHYYLRGENMTIMGSVSPKRTCSYCNTASCGIGTYMTGDYSKPCQCRNCTLKYPGLIFSSEGKILDDISSCHQQCPDGFFGNDYMRVCIPWTPLICDSEFYLQQGTSATDAICLPCTKCHNSLLVSNCTNISDSVCIACPDVGPGSIYENSNCTLKCMDGYILNQETQICDNCRSFQCAVGSILSSNPHNCSHCIPCQNILPPDSSYTFECTWKCDSGYVYNVEQHRCIQYANQLQYPSTISQKSSVSCPYDHYLRSDFSCDLCENYPNQHPSNLKPENISTWSWVASLQTCTWDCNPPLLYFVHIASYGHGHASPKCYTSTEIQDILNTQEKSSIVISEQNVSLIKSNPGRDVMSPILFSFFIIFAIFLFIFAFFYPLLVGKPDHLDHPEIEDAEAPDTIPNQVTTEEDE